MSEASNKTALIKSLIDFFNDPSKAFHHHSFTSYLADELANIGLINYQNSHHYDAKTIVSELQQHLSLPKSMETDDTTRSESF
jgi:hypothetical protein